MLYVLLSHSMLCCAVWSVLCCAVLYCVVLCTALTFSGVGGQLPLQDEVQPRLPRSRYRSGETQQPHTHMAMEAKSAGPNMLQVLPGHVRFAVSLHPEGVHPIQLIVYYTTHLFLHTRTHHRREECHACFCHFPSATTCNIVGATARLACGPPTFVHTTIPAHTTACRRCQTSRTASASTMRCTSPLMTGACTTSSSSTCECQCWCCHVVCHALDSRDNRVRGGGQEGAHNLWIQLFSKMKHSG